MIIIFIISRMPALLRFAKTAALCCQWFGYMLPDPITILAISVLVFIYDEWRRSHRYHVRVQYVFDTSALIAIPKDVTLRDAAVPVATIQELLSGIRSSDQLRALRNRTVLRFLREQKTARVLPGFKDTVRRALGEDYRFWPREERGWRLLTRMAAENAPWTVLAAQWNDLYTAQMVELSEMEYSSMKQNSHQFKSEYQGGLDRLREESPVESDELSPSNPALSSGTPDFSGQARTVPELMILAQLAGMAGIEVVDQMLYGAGRLQHEAAGELRYYASRKALQLYRGGLDFVIRITAQLSLVYTRGQRHVDGNDFFDLMIMASVDDGPETVFVTEEVRIHETAERLGLRSRVIRAQAYLAVNEL